jgi:Meiotically up-regulated gene 113
MSKKERGKVDGSGGVMMEGIAFNGDELRRPRRAGTETDATATLYVVYCEGFAKIGVTGANLKGRISELQNGCPFPIECIAGWTIPSKDAHIVEYNANVILNDSHHFGDWFRCSREAARAAAEAAAKFVGGTSWRIQDAKARQMRATPAVNMASITIAPDTAKKSARSKSVSTERGEYPSVAAAARAHGISRQAGHYRVQQKIWGLVVPP